MISDSNRLYGQFSMGGHIIPEAEKEVKHDVMDPFARPLSTSYLFLSLLQAKQEKSHQATFWHTSQCSGTPCQLLLNFIITA
jgi:hypothetical protein